ncbi:uncharacterized protein BO80DRAFT_17173 [Aspergillus ibericus CBS 121593]|uniref:FAD/NAD(P)-binding domain-containing protein n=1 Tax=Aspergillus ibericus CBS 121593 TaxID=1448316 RepID=A0A395H631_9EURO|nr:hypothetical protein BO80DRAFT_17173 [Aspergillus ibericus CBS 121593]RAL03347.1 hypothetical protein BO80DRAFT_17173 [Aspergillus ibericus CBS 121593]
MGVAYGITGSDTAVPFRHMFCFPEAYGLVSPANPKSDPSVRLRGGGGGTRILVNGASLSHRGVACYRKASRKHGWCYRDTEHRSSSVGVTEGTAAALRDAGADARGYAIEPRPIQGLERAHSTADARDVLRVWLGPSGEETSVDIGFLTHIPDTTLTNDWTSQLGLEVDAHGLYKQKDATMETMVPGIFVVGDHASMAKDVPNAASNATFVASAVAVQLTAEH